MTSTPPPRPAGVPAEASWDPSDWGEWVHGPRDADGAYHGVVEYFRRDGTLCCRCPFEHGKPHGLSQRFHENGELSGTGDLVHGVLHGKRVWIATDSPTTEKMHAPHRSIVRVEADYDNGSVVGMRYFDRAGRVVDMTGTPLPPRPPSVPASAQYHGPTRTWMGLSVGVREGVQPTWDEHGGLLAEESYRSGAPHGRWVRYHEGTHAVPRLVLEFADGLLDGTCEVRRLDGTLRRRARFRAGAPVGGPEDFDEAGRSLPPIELPDADATAAAAVPTPEERALLDSLGTGDAPTAAVAVLSPAATAYAIARGWGGDQNRDAAGARAARALVRRIAPPSLAERLAEIGLDRAPRLLTASRVKRVVDEIGGDPSVDRPALERALAESGGAAIGVTLARGGAPARALLAQRTRNNKLGLARLALDRVPAEVELFPQLEEIDLGRNELVDLPRELAAVFLLRTLNVSHNRIRTMAPELARLTELRYVNLSANRLDQLPDGLLSLSDLTTLNLDGNELATLPEDFGRLENLEEMWLSSNPLRSLPESFTRLRRLTFLHLGDVGWEEPPPHLFELASLETLWLAGRSLRRLPREVARLSHLRMLSLWYSNLTELPDELYEMKHLRELRIRDNPLPAAVFERLRAALPDCTIY